MSEPQSRRPPPVHGVKRILAFLSGGAMLVGASLSWRGVDLEDSDTDNLDKYEKMALRFEGVAVFLAGALAVFAALVGGKYSGAAKYFFFTIVGITFYSILQSRRFSLDFLNRMRIDREAHDHYTSFKAHYFSGGLIVYGGFILSALSAPGEPGGRFGLKVFLSLKTTALALIALFLIGTSSTSTAYANPSDVTTTVAPALQQEFLNARAIYVANMNVMATVFLVWLFSVAAAINGSRELAGASGLVFGAHSYFILEQLLTVNDLLGGSAANYQAHQTRAGYVIGWFVGFFAFLLALPVYSKTPKSSAVVKPV